MPSVSPIATRTLFARDAAGREFTLVLGIGQPYAVSSDEWACPLRLDGLHDRLHDMHGVDSWQALQLAYQLVGSLLGTFLRQGGTLYWPGTQERVSLDKLLPTLPQS